MDPIFGCPALSVPKDHIAHAVRDLIARLDVSAAEALYSSQGRRGYHPRHMLGALVLGSLLGEHASTRLGQSLRTDAALRLVSGGYAISAGRLRAFRQRHAELFADCIEQSVKMAFELGLLDEKELAVDAMRLRANAARNEARTLDHATKRIKELEAVDPATLSPDDSKVRDEKLVKHRHTVAECTKRGSTNIVATNPSASLMKFPTGATAPGHRITVTAAGTSRRLVIAVLVDADPNDYGKLAPALQQARAVLTRAGVPPDTPLQAAADAGYNSEADLRFAERNRHWVDVLVPMQATPHADTMTKGYFGRDKFVILQDGKMHCPAGTQMRGPISNGDERVLYRGVGCEQCPIKAQCTPHKRRAITLHPAVDRQRKLMRERMEQPDAADRYKHRMATVEPVFSSLQHGMNFRRSTTRHDGAIVAEILLKVLAHNISRLAAAKRLAVVVCAFET